LEKENLKEERCKQSKVMIHKPKVSLEECKEQCKVDIEEQRLMWEQQQKIMFCGINTFRGGCESICGGNEGSTFVAQRISALMNNFGGPSGAMHG
jgi:hypothetical protein